MEVKRGLMEMLMLGVEVKRGLMQMLMLDVETAQWK